MNESNQFALTFDQTRLHIQWNKVKRPQAIVVIAHGLAEHSGRYDYVTQVFNQASISVLRYDQRGHGLSEGEKGYLKEYKELFHDCNQMIEVAIKEYPNCPVFLLGHSMGGYTAAGFGILYPKKVNGLIFSGPLTVDSANILQGVDLSLDPFLKSPNSLADLICSNQDVVEQYKNDELNLKEISLGLMQQIAISRPWMQEHLKDIIDPVLVLHGREDRLVSVHDGELLFELASSTDKSMKIFEDLWHEILNEDAKDEVLKHIVDWIEDRI